MSYQHCDSDHVNDVINRELGKLMNWCVRLDCLRLFINYLKTKFLLYNRIAKKSEFSVKVNGFVFE